EGRGSEEAGGKPFTTVTSHDLSLSSKSVDEDVVLLLAFKMDMFSPVLYVLMDRLCWPLLLAMWRTISRAAQQGLGPASAPTPSLGFWSKFWEFRETERGITVECVAKNLAAMVAVWGSCRLVDYGDYKASTQLAELHAELKSERKRRDKLKEQLKELRDRDIYGRVPTRTSVFLRRNVGFCIAVPWCLYAFSSYFMDFDGYWKRRAEKRRFEIKEVTRDLDSMRKMREEMEHSVMSEVCTPLVVMSCYKQKSQVKMRRAMEILESEAGSIYCSTWQNICFCGQGV
ncbi:putative endonuclease, partial [Striga asiatica]